MPWGTSLTRSGSLVSNKRRLSESTGHFLLTILGSRMWELKVMKTRDQRFTDIAPKVYHTICIPSKVCVIHFATRVEIIAGKSWDVGNECSWRRILQIVRRSDCRFRLFFYRHGLMKVFNCLFSGLLLVCFFNCLFTCFFPHLFRFFYRRFLL